MRGKGGVTRIICREGAGWLAGTGPCGVDQTYFLTSMPRAWLGGRVIQGPRTGGSLLTLPRKVKSTDFLVVWGRLNSWGPSLAGPEGQRGGREVRRGREENNTLCFNARAAVLLCPRHNYGPKVLEQICPQFTVEEPKAKGQCYAYGCRSRLLGAFMRSWPRLQRRCGNVKRDSTPVVATECAGRTGREPPACHPMSGATILKMPFYAWVPRRETFAAMLLISIDILRQHFESSSRSAMARTDLVRSLRLVLACPCLYAAVVRFEDLSSVLRLKGWGRSSPLFRALTRCLPRRVKNGIVLGPPEQRGTARESPVLASYTSCRGDPPCR